MPSDAIKSDARSVTRRSSSLSCAIISSYRAQRSSSKYPFGLVGTESDYTLIDSDIIINATSLGLKQTDKLPFNVNNSSPNSVIADIIMQPEETELLKYAKSLGRSIHYGKYMIESQIDLVGNFLEIW